MGTRNAFLEEAVSHNGYLETPVNRTKFGKAFGWDGVAWCHIYLSVCAKWSGNGDIIPWTASCWHGMNWFAQRGQFIRRGKGKPQPGDLVYYGSAGQDHVGLVYAVDGGHIYTIEGNTSNASGFNPNGGGVHKKKWSLNYSRIYGYGRPAYTEAQESEAPDMYVSLGSKNWKGRPRRGQSIYVHFDMEYSDRFNQHGDGKAYPTVLVTPSYYVATVGVTVEGMPPDGKCWIRFVEVQKENGKFPITEVGPAQTIVGTADGGPVHVTHTNADTILHDRRLRIQMGGFSHDGATVRPTSLKILAWKR